MAPLENRTNRPNFFVIGASRSGTTRLHYLLGLHTEVFMPENKEPDYFVRSNPSPETYKQYFELFNEANNAKAIGESSTIYSRSQRWPGTAQRIFNYNPQAKLIYMVRHPLRRLESCWVESRARYNPTPANFCEAIRSNIIDSMDATLYWKQLSQYRPYFPDSQILLLFFEDFIRDEPATLKRCFEFLGVNSNASIDCSTQERQNASIGKQEAKPFLDIMRRVPNYSRLRLLIPRSLKAKLRPNLLRPIQTKPTWDEETLHWAIEQLQDDTHQFLSHAEKLTTFWQWDPSPNT
ncbi:sulfotransferase, partial [bacterium]